MEQATAERTTEHRGTVSAASTPAHALAESWRAANPRWWRDALRRRLLALADVLAALLATALIAVPTTGSAWPLAAAPLALVLAKLLGLYDRDHRALRHLTADEVPSIGAWAAALTAALALLLPIVSGATLTGGAAAEFVITVGLVDVILRSIARWLWWRRTPPELVAVLGDSEGFQAIRRKLALFPDMHLQLAAEHQIEELTDADDDALLNELTNGVDRIIVSSTRTNGALIERLSPVCRHNQVKLSVISPLRGRALPESQMSRLGDLAILEYNTSDRSRSTLIIKRLLDAATSLFALALFLPLLPFVALAIKLDSRGPVFFSQIRAGIGGRPFRMYKLRTMRLDAESELDGLVDFTELDEPAFKLREDPRVTRVGRWLRRLSLDELPQLLNVFVGEMSIVGPRPEQIELVGRYSSEDRVRLLAKPGMTGPMQILGRGNLTFSERLAVEIEYVDNPSLARDLRIMLRTVPVVLRGSGAF